MSAPRKALSWIGHRGREALLWPRIAAPALLTGRGPRIAFLPSGAGLGSSRLRAIEMARALTRQGWNAVWLPPQLELGQRERVLRRFAPDALIFQKVLHPLNRAEHGFGLPFLLDLDDADFCHAEQAVHLEALARQGRGVIAGSRHIRNWAAAFTPQAHVVWTGTPISPGPRPPQASRAPIVTWAQASPLRYPEEMAFVETVMRAVAARAPGVILRLYGIKSPQVAADLARRFDFVTLQCQAPLPYERFLTSLREVAVGLCPIIPSSPFSLGKSFGKVLGYLDARVPVICSDQADHALFFTPASGVVSEDPAVWSAETLRLLADAPAREAMASAAFADFEARLSQPAAARRLGEVLKRVI